MKLTDASKEADRVSRDSSEIEARCATMTVDLESARSHNDTLQSQCQSLKHEVNRDVTKFAYERNLDLYIAHKGVIQ